LARTIWTRSGAIQQPPYTVWTTVAAIDAVAATPPPPSGVVTSRRIRLAEEDADDEIWRPIRSTTADSVVPPEPVVPAPPRLWRQLWHLDEPEPWRPRRFALGSVPTTDEIVTKLSGYAVLNASPGETSVVVTKLNVYVIAQNALLRPYLSINL
jgi:hypothetical protein